MLRRSLQAGLLIGVLLALTMAYVVINDQVGGALPDTPFVQPPLVPHDVIRAFSLYASGLLLLVVGTAAAAWVRPRRLRDGVNAGAMSGLVAGMVVFLLLFSPVIVVRQAIPLYQQMIASGIPYQQALPGLPVEAFLDVWQLSLGTALFLPVVGLVIGAVEGWLYALARRILGRRAPEPPSPVLLDWVRGVRGARWIERGEHALRAGLLGGLLVGGFLALEMLVLLQGVAASAPALPGQDVHLPSVLPEFLPQLARALIFLIPLALVLWGGSGVLLLRHPPSRFGTRIQASIITGLAGGLVFTMVVILPLLNVFLLTVPLIPASVNEQPQLPPLTMERVLGLSRGIFLVYPLLALLPVLLSTLLAFFLGLPVVFFAALVWPRHPVDRAAGLARRLRRQPEHLLPEIYALFQRDRHAVEVLQHLAHASKKAKQGDAATVAAAYHTLYQHPPRMVEALDAIADILADSPTLRWHSEVGSLLRLLEEGLQARNIHHLAAIRPLPEEQTSSLPAVLAQAGEHLSRLVAEVKKAQRLDDPNGRTIYLNRALEELAATKRFVEERMGPGKGYATPLPERQVLLVLLPRWETVLHEALRDLRGRAVLRAELLSRQVAYVARLSLHLRVTNEGLNVAERVRIALQPGPDYQVLPESEARLDLLPPGESRDVELALEPRSARRMRVLLRLLYNDAVDENRELALADEVVFVEESRPFQRIFPIPYVTGTPLKSGEMFFGREDVFAYVREHLLGAYQNNIIVLHGQRRTGKTSVLYRLPEVLRDTHYCVLLDMQGLAARNEAEFFYTLSDEIAYALERAGVQVELPPRAEYEAQPEFTFRARFLRGLYPLLREKHLLLMFDEFEELQAHVEAGRLGAEIFPFLRNLMQHERPVDFIFAGTHRLEELAAGYWSILFNIATYKKISFLEPDEVRRLVTEPVAPFGLEYDPLAVERIAEVTAGHPFLTQLVCHELVSYHNETERSYLTVADVDLVLERIAERGEAHFKYVWSEADSAERAVMLALAERLTHAEAATVDEVRSLSEHRGRMLSSEQAAHALLRLEARDIVARTAPGSERFRFRVDLVRRWIARNPQLGDTVGLPESG